jgi:SAC3/GANP family
VATNSSDKEDGKKKSYPDADPLKTVKEYSRSAAGLAAPKASELRPLPVLIKTTNYLIRYY